MCRDLIIIMAFQYPSIWWIIAYLYSLIINKIKYSLANNIVNSHIYTIGGFIYDILEYIVDFLYVTL
jgi:hypothetical protein